MTEGLLRPLPTLGVWHCCLDPGQDPLPRNCPEPDGSGPVCVQASLLPASHWLLAPQTCQVLPGTPHPCLGRPPSLPSSSQAVLFVRLLSGVAGATLDLGPTLSPLTFGPFHALWTQQLLLSPVWVGPLGGNPAMWRLQEPWVHQSSGVFPLALAGGPSSLLCCCLAAKSCLTLCSPMGCSLPGSPVPGMLQARILGWVATFFSRGSSRPRDGTHISCVAAVSCFVGVLFTTEPSGKSPAPSGWGWWSKNPDSAAGCLGSNPAPSAVP